MNTSSETRNHHVTSGYNELQKFDREFSSFETWLRSAERTLDAYLMDVARDRDALRKQVAKLQPFNEEVVSHSADLRFMNISGQKFLDENQVSVTSVYPQETFLSQRTFFHLEPGRPDSARLENCTVP